MTRTMGHQTVRKEGKEGGGGSSGVIDNNVPVQKLILVKSTNSRCGPKSYNRGSQTTLFVGQE